MRHRFRWTLLLGLCVVASCGGGGGSSAGSTTSSGSSTSSSSSRSSSSSSSSSSSGGTSSSSTSSSSSGASGSNVIAITVGPGPPAANGGTFNVSYASVKLCQPGTSTCATINDVLVDTGSYGLRIFASALQASGLTLAVQPDPNHGSNSLAECLPFADGYTWGPLVTADLSIGGERAAGLSVNIIDDNSSYAPTAPSGCTSTNGSMSLNSITALSANGVLGVGPFDQDCGTACAECNSLMGGCTSSNDIYYSCNSGSNSCTLTQVALTAQVRNPVALFAVDNNGVIVQLPAIPAAGQVGAVGSLIFGIATQSNNALGSATVLTANFEADITTLYNGQNLTSSFFDSGSNGLYFPDNSIPVCAGFTNASDFFCPASTLQRMATNEGQNGAVSMVDFDITNLKNRVQSDYANAEIGGPAATNTALGPYFDWGLPFFYGKSVYTAINGMPAGSATGPYYAYR